jgi:hypothetical protein
MVRFKKRTEEGGGWGPGPDRRAVSRPTAARPRQARGLRGVVQTGEHRGPLTHGPQSTTGGRGEERGAWAGLEKKGNGPSPKKREDFLFIQIEFKQVRTVLIKRWTYQDPKIPNKICMERN